MKNANAQPLSAKYDELVAAIVRVVPECATREWNAGHGSSDEGWYPANPTLEDVLRTVKEKVGLYQTTTHPMSPIAMLLGTVDFHCVTEWRLGHSLEWHRDNAPETISFLHSLLV